MEYFCFLPAIMSCIIAIYAFVRALDKKDDWVWRSWKFIFGVIFTIATICLTNLGLEEVGITKQYNTYHSYQFDNF